MLALKDNQRLLLEGVDELFETKFKDRETRFKECSRTDKGHGRVTTRTCCHTDYLEWMSEKDRDGWADLTSVCRVETETVRASRLVFSTPARQYPARQWLTHPTLTG